MSLADTTTTTTIVPTEEEESEEEEEGCKPFIEDNINNVKEP
jgi:hypothetical protein